MTATSHSSTDDLLKFFDSFSIQKETVFQESDLKFCEQQQALLYKTLDEIQRWYDIFCKEVEKFAEIHELTYKEDGSITIRDYYREINNESPDYTRYEFKPFEDIGILVKNRKKAICAFAENIIRYFNRNYSISATIPDINDNYAPDYRPLYTDYTKLVEQHLQGRGFRETAEEELINRFHALVYLYRSNNPPQLKSDKIIFQNLFRFTESYHLSQPSHRLDYGYDSKLDAFCEGILFGSNTLLNGNSKIICDYDYRNVDINRWYPLNFESNYAIKFYLNGRIDVRFPDAAKAKNCFDRLHLNNGKQIIGE
jgi:hypothetical protein